MPKNKVTGKNRGEIVGFVRFALDAQEMALLDEACQFEERCRADLARLYTLRYCNIVLSQYKSNVVLSKADSFISDLKKAIDEELNKDKKKK